MPWRRAVHEYLVRTLTGSRLFQHFVDSTQHTITTTASRIANKEPLFQPRRDSELKDGFTNLYRRK
ncbi:hypothetical protein HK105_202439 [Polyrhizophydium stewartii]|uniref:Uncharacterized protein n=1 Tax=Polyrhizophydium stewartii TaxID=2732419 RepID=A0ABR4NES2_9FUNG